MPNDLVHINAYTRNDGTFVKEHWRKRVEPDGIIPEEKEGGQGTTTVPEQPKDELKGTILNMSGIGSGNVVPSGGIETNVGGGGRGTVLGIVVQVAGLELR